MRIGTLFGVRLKVHPLFLLLLAAAAAGGQILPVAVLFGLLLTHETAHLLVARACRLHVAELEFLPFGGVARIEGLSRAEAGVEALVALAGPLNNLLLLAAGFWLREAGLLQPGVAGLFLEGNTALALFNLIPVLPLDGGRVCRGFLARRLGYGRATRFLARLGQLAGLALVAGGVLALHRGYIAPNAFLLGAFLYVAAGRERTGVKLEEMRFLWRKREKIQRDCVMPVNELIALERTPLRELVGRLAPNGYNRIWVADERLGLRGVIEEPVLVDALAERGPDVTLGELL